MRLRDFIGGAVLGLASAAGLAAPVAYDADFAWPAGTFEGSVGGFSWFLDDGSGVDFVRFQARAGMTVTLSGERLHANLDPALSVYRGTTGADTSAFDSAGDWGGMSFLMSLDDEHPPATGSGGFGDPFGSFAITADGVYTVAIGGGSGSTDAGAYPYRITLAFVPEPASSLLALIALGAMGASRRRTGGTSS